MSAPSSNSTQLASEERPEQAKRRLGALPRYILIRLAVSVLLMWGVTVVTFSLTNLVPADPIQAALGEQAASDPAIVAQFRKDAGLDKPLIVQYGHYLAQLLQGNLGKSIQTRNPVADDLARAFPATAELATVAIVMALVLGIGLGVWAALRRGKPADHAIRIISLAGLSVPTFWLALVALFVLTFKFPLLPGAGRLDPVLMPPPKVTGMYVLDGALAGHWDVAFNALSHLLLPASVLALYTVGLLTRFSRSSVLEVLSLDYIRTARAKGLPARTVLFRYILRGALVPIITMVGLAFGSLLSGTVLVEKIFAWHGLGEYAFLAATKLDLPAVMGVGLIVGGIYIIINFIVDLLYGVIDPRVRLQ